MIIHVPTIHDSYADFQSLFRIRNSIPMIPGETVVFDFTRCRFLMQSGVALLGALARDLQARSQPVQFNWHSLDPAIRANLAQNGFIEAFGGTEHSWSGNSIPYREDRYKDSRGLMDYLKQYWLGRGWVGVSPPLRNSIVGRVWEIYENAFTHSRTVGGVFTCGQHYPRKQQLALTVAEFGIGIAKSVQDYYKTQFETIVGSWEPAYQLQDEEALEVAFQRGFSTRPQGEAAGMGLDLLKEFVRLNGGTLQVFSNLSYAHFDGKGETYCRQATSFQGTVVNITIICDQRYYCLAGEVPANAG